MCVCMNMHAGCECNVVIATCPQHDLESTFLRCDNVAFTTLPQPKHNVVTTSSQRDFVCWVDTFPILPIVFEDSTAGHCGKMLADMKVILQYGVIGINVFFCPSELYLMGFYYPPGVSNMKYCCLGVFRKGYFRLITT